MATDTLAHSTAHAHEHAHHDTGPTKVFGFAMIWHIWWMAIVGFAGIVISWIVKSFDEDVDYYVPVAEVEKLENQHFDEISKAGLKNGN